VHLNIVPVYSGTGIMENFENYSSKFSVLRNIKSIDSSKEVLESQA